MNRKIIYIGLVCLLVVILGGCSFCFEENAEDDVLVDCYEVYELDNPDSTFNMVVQNNPIDISYEQEFYNDAGTTSEFIEVQKKYLEIWEEELRCSTEAYMNCLTKEDSITFANSQQAFEDYVETAFSYDSYIIQQHQYEIYLGDSAAYLLLSQRRETIRNRAIHIKYLHYLLERANQEGDADTFSSLKFVSIN